MYESKTVPFESPERFRIEILFSPGANFNPFEVDLTEDHVLPPVSRVHLEDAEQVIEGGVLDQGDIRACVCVQISTIK